MANIDVNETYEFDKIITTDYFSFTLKKSLFFNLDNLSSSKNYSFKLHQIDNLCYKLRKEININPINKEASMLKLTIKGKTPKKNITILNKLTEIYIRNGLDDKNLMANNTIHFIDEQLAIIQDSLTLIEINIKDFRLQNPNLTIMDKDYGTYFQKQKLDNTLSEQSVNIKYYQSLLSYLKNDNNANSIVSPTSMGISNPELNSLINQLLQ